MGLSRVLTIGVYGFDAPRFFDALLSAEIDLFCDLRARRGVRGSAYAFANARRLEHRLSELRIPYRHFPNLAPTEEARRLQHATDTATRTLKRERTQLAASFSTAYGEQLSRTEAQADLQAIRDSSTSPILFCVERLPSACHRSLVAAALAGKAIVPEHIVP